MFTEKRNRKPEYIKARTAIIARASAWNKANAERRNALRRENRQAAVAALEKEKNFWADRKQELIAEFGREKGLKRLDYEKHREKRVAKSKEWAANNREKRREISRTWAAKNRAQNPEAAKARDREYYKNNRHKLSNKAADWAADNPRNPDWYKARKHKLIARSLAGIAKRCGEIVVEKCSDCGSTTDLEMHHHDYSKPLDVIPLCRTCHRERHS